jgi:hypothetical protein
MTIIFPEHASNSKCPTFLLEETVRKGSLLLVAHFLFVCRLWVTHLQKLFKGLDFLSHFVQTIYHHLQIWNTETTLRNRSVLLILIYILLNLENVLQIFWRFGSCLQLMFTALHLLVSRKDDRSLKDFVIKVRDFSSILSFVLIYVYILHIYLLSVV